MTAMETATSPTNAIFWRPAPAAASLGPWPVSYPPPASVGSYGWPGIYGTGWYNDPAEDMTTILMIQRAPAPPGLPILFDFWTAAYQAIDD